MKKYTLLAGFGLAILISAFSYSTKTIDLLDAIDQGLIEVTASSLGGSSMDCVDLQIRSKSDRNLYVSVDPGLRLRTQDPGYQDILVTRPETLLVQSFDEKSSDLYGFCCQSHNMTPEQESEFIIGGYDGGDLGKLANRLAADPVDPDIEQESIWTISDRHNLASIYSLDEDQTQELREFCADLRGEDVPWYDIDYGNVLDAPFVDEPETLSGKLIYMVEDPGTSDLVVYDPDGEILVSFFEGRHMSRAEYTQTFSFSATNMKRGTYRFVLLLEGEEVAAQELVL